MEKKSKQILKPLFVLIYLLFSYSITVQTNNSIDSVTLYTYIGRIPQMNFLEALKEVANENGIKTEIFFGDCGGTFDDKEPEFEKKNQPAYELLKQNYGTNWKEQFEL